MAATTLPPPVQGYVAASDAFDGDSPRQSLTARKGEITWQ
jgi:hypothetical protein